MDLTHALAHSNNYFFATLGQKLGFEKVSYYAHQFGYGEKAGLDIPGEGPGRFPSVPPSNGGVGMLTSFGEEISQTPLQFAALMSAVANGGTLYYLRYPRTLEEIASFSPRIKRQLDIQPLFPALLPGFGKRWNLAPRTGLARGSRSRARQALAAKAIRIWAGSDRSTMSPAGSWWWWYC
jgi:penicillin-binding protein 2